MDRYVDVAALNFRDAPQGNILGTVFLGQKLENVESSGTDGWVSATATLDGVTKPGFVSAKYLRAPLSPTREALITSVHRQWMRFNRGTGQEHVKPFSSYVGEMWKAIKMPHLDGTDRDIPWSAACISFIVREAGAPYAGFKFAAAHSKYIHHAIKGRFAKDTSVPFWGYDLHERKPQVGDIICKDNPQYAPAVNFAVARHENAYRSHCDIIVKIDSPSNKITAIGGNVGDSVAIAEYDLAPGDLLAPTKHVFALLANITDME